MSLKYSVRSSCLRIATADRCNPAAVAKPPPIVLTLLPPRVDATGAVAIVLRIVALATVRPTFGAAAAADADCANVAVGDDDDADDADALEVEATDVGLLVAIACAFSVAMP